MEGELLINGYKVSLEQEECSNWQTAGRWAPGGSHVVVALESPESRVVGSLEVL